MRPLALVLLLALGGCGAPEEHLRLATVDAQQGLDMRLRELPESTLRALGLPYGLAVVALGAAAEQAGLRVGDVVYGVNQTRIRNLQDFGAAMERPAGGVRLWVRRGRSDLSVPLDLEAVRAPHGAPRDGNRLPLLRQPRDTLLRT